MGKERYRKLSTGSTAKWGIDFVNASYKKKRDGCWGSKENSGMLGVEGGCTRFSY